MAFSPELQEKIKVYATKWGIDPIVATNLVLKESSGNPKATSKDKQGRPLAKGLTQLTDLISKKYGATDPYDVDQNLDAGFHYLSDLKKSYKDNMEEALAHYNGGPGAVKYFREKGGIFYDPSMGVTTWANQTGNYVKTIMANSGSDVSHIPTGQRDKIIASRKLGDIVPNQDTAGGAPVIAQAPLDSKKKVPLRIDSAGGAPVLQEQAASPIDMKSMFAKAGQQNPINALAEANPVNLLFSPAQAQDTGASDLLDQEDTVNRANQSREPSFDPIQPPAPPPIAAPSIAQATSDPQNIVVPPLIQNIGASIGATPQPPSSPELGGLYAGVASKASVLNLPIGVVNTALGLTGQEQIPFIDPGEVQYGQSTINELEEKHPWRTLLGRLATDMPIIGGIAKAPVPAAVKAGLMGGTFLSEIWGRQIGERQTKELKIDPTAKPGGVESLAPTNYAEIATAGVLGAGGEFLGPIARGVGAGLKTGGKILKQGPKVIPEAIQAGARVMMDEARLAPLALAEKRLARATSEELTSIMSQKDKLGGLKIDLRKRLDLAESLVKESDKQIKLQFANSKTGEISKPITEELNRLVEDYKKSVDIPQIFDDNLSPYDPVVFIKPQVLDKIEKTAKDLGVDYDFLKETIANKAVHQEQSEVLKDVLGQLDLPDDSIARKAALEGIPDYKRMVISEGAKGKPDFFKTWTDKLQNKGVEQTKVELNNHVAELQGELQGQTQGVIEEGLGDLKNAYNSLSKQLTKAYDPKIVNTKEQLISSIRQIANVDRKLGNIYFRNIDKNLAEPSLYENSTASAMKNLRLELDNLKTRATMDRNPSLFRQAMTSTIKASEEMLDALKIKEPVKEVVTGIKAVGGELVDKFKTLWARTIANPTDVAKFYESVGVRGAGHLVNGLKGFSRNIHVEETLRWLPVEEAYAKAGLIKAAPKEAKAFFNTVNKLPYDEFLDTNRKQFLSYLKNPESLRTKFIKDIPELKDVKVTRETIELLRARSIAMDEERILAGLPKPAKGYVYNKVLEDFENLEFKPISNLLKQLQLDERLGGMLRTKTFQPWLEHRTGGNHKLLENAYWADRVRIGNAVYKRNADKFLAFAYDNLRARNFDKKLHNPLVSAITQLTGSIRKSDLEKKLIDPVLNNATLNILNTPSFAVLDLMQVIFPWARYSGNTANFDVAMDILTNPIKLESAIAVFKNTGLYQGTATQDMLQAIGAGKVPRFELMGKLASDFEKRLGHRGSQIGKILLNHPFIEGPEFAIKTFTAVASLADKYGAKLPSILDSLRKPHSNMSLFKEAANVVFDAVDEHLFVKSPFHSLLGRQSSILRFSTFSGRALALMYKWAIKDPQTLSRAFQALYLTGGAQTLLPMIQLINQTHRILGNKGDLITSTDFTEAEFNAQMGRIPGAARLLGPLNAIFDLGLGARQSFEILGPFPIQKQMVLDAQKIAKGDISPMDMAVFLATYGLNKSFFVSSPKTFSDVVKQFTGDPTSTNFERQIPGLQKDTITVYGSRLNKKEIVIKNWNQRIQSLLKVGKQPAILRRYVDAAADLQALERERARIETWLNNSYSKGNPDEIEKYERELEKAVNRRDIEKYKIIDAFKPYLSEDFDLEADLDQDIKVSGEGVFEGYKEAITERILTTQRRLDSATSDDEVDKLSEQLSELRSEKNIYVKPKGRKASRKAERRRLLEAVELE